MKVRIEVSMKRTFVAAHSLPDIGYAPVHDHTYELECGYTAEVDPNAGCTRPLQAVEAELEDVIARVEGKDLNALLAVPPTAEMLVCWILAHLPNVWQWASITAYGGYTCRVERKDIDLLLPLLQTPEPAARRP